MGFSKNNPYILHGQLTTVSSKVHPKICDSSFVPRFDITAAKPRVSALAAVLFEI